MTRTALLVMDIQNGVLNMVKAQQSYFDSLTTTIASARAAKTPIIFVKSGLRPGFPDASERNKAVTRVIGLGNDVFVEGSDFTAFHPTIGPDGKDIVILKRRNSAFSGTDLETVLRSLHVDHLVLLGVMTSGVVLSTVRQAADLDYRITVLEDLCLDLDPDVQQVLMRKVFPGQATVISAEEWTSALGTAQA